MHCDTMACMTVGQKARVCRMDTRGAMRRRLRDLGIIEGAPVECVARDRSGDPAAFLVCGAVIALRAEDLRKISVVPEAGI